MERVSAWQIPAFRRVWGSSAVGVLGGEIGELAMPVLALVSLGASAQELSAVRAATFAPYLLLTLWLGVLVDRRSRRPLMIAAETGRGLILLVVAGLALAGALSVPLLVVAAFTVGALAVLHMLADFSFLPQVVDERRLPDANAKITATQSAIGIGGAGVGGGLVQALTAPVAVAVNGVAHLLAARLLTQVRVDEPPPTAGEGGAAAQAWAGLRAMAGHRTVRALAAEATVWNLGNEILMLGITVALVQGRSDGPLVLGLILVAGGLGAFVGAAASARLTQRWGYGRSLVAALLLGNSAPVVGVLLAGSASGRSLLVLGAAFLVSGLGVGIANSQAVTVRQLSVPEELRGRVNAAYRLVSWGALAVGALTAGALVAAWGEWRAALIGGALMALASLPVVLSPVRRMRSLADVPG